MESVSPRVVGNPQAGRLFGAKSREALTEREHRRSAQFSAAVPTPAPPPQVIYVPLPSPPRPTVDDSWQDDYMRRARLQCGLPISRHAPAPWPGTAPAGPESDTTYTGSSDAAEELRQEPRPSARPASPSFWTRLRRAFGCLGRN